MESDLNASYEPAQALSDARSSRQAAAARVVSPWWYHLILGLNLGALVLAVGLPAVSVMTLATVGVVSALISGLLANVYRRLTGVWVGPQQCGPRSRRIWAGIFGLIFACLAVAALVRFAGLPAACTVAAAAVGCVGIVILGRAFDVALREEIRTGQATAELRR